MNDEVTDRMGEVNNENPGERGRAPIASSNVQLRVIMWWPIGSFSLWDSGLRPYAAQDEKFNLSAVSTFQNKQVG